MTHTEIYRAWHSLPEYFKDEVRQDYAKALEANELDPKNERIDAHIIFLEKYFGKHNLTATAQNCEKSVEKGVSGNADYEKVDWLAYRMELAKDTLRYITSCSTPQEMKANELADYVMTTVDGIVERLKGGIK